MSRESIYLPQKIEKSNQPRETRMSDLDLQSRKIRSQYDRLLAEGRLSVQKTYASRGVINLLPALALFRYMPLMWYLRRV
jgi:hypothetical protein